MKAKKFGITVFLACALVVVFSMNVNAAEAFYTCTIDRVGGANSLNPMVMYVMLSDTKATPTFTRKYFRIPDANKKEVLAILLTAMSNNTTVTVWADEVPASSNDRLIKQIYLEN